MKKKKKKILFIGSFKSKSTTGHVGGQMFACNSLINSELKDNYEWILIDTTANTNLKRSFLNRLFMAILRLIKSFYYILFGRIDIAMAFCSGGHSFLEKGLVIRFAKLCNKKTILAPRDGFLIDQINNSEAFKNKVLRIFKSTDTVICQGTFWKSYFLNNFDLPKDKFIVINNWIKSTNYQSKKRSINNPIQLLFLGWVEKNKGVWDVLEAMKQLKGENIKLTIAGKGEDFDRFKKAIIENDLTNEIDMIGWILGSDKYKLLHNSDILILPSYREGLPNSLLEAMSSRTAVIVSNVGAISDVITNGLNGFLIRPGKPQEIESCIRKYLMDNNLINTHAENALKNSKIKKFLRSSFAPF